MAQWAVFDVDGTLLPGKSMEFRYILRKMKHLKYPPQNFFRYFYHAAKIWRKKDIMEALIANKYYLKGLSEVKNRLEGKQFVDNVIIPLVAGKGLQTIKEYKELGYKILVMSGSPDYLTVPLADFLKPHYLISCKLKTKNGKFTGEVDGLHPFGERKTRLLHELRSDLELDFESSVAFGNHHYDVHHLSLFGKSVAVNPTDRLRKIAEEKGWDIEYWG